MIFRCHRGKGKAWYEIMYYGVSVADDYSVGPRLSRFLSADEIYFGHPIHRYCSCDRGCGSTDITLTLPNSDKSVPLPRRADGR